MPRARKTAKSLSPRKSVLKSGKTSRIRAKLAPPRAPKPKNVPNPVPTVGNYVSGTTKEAEYHQFIEWVSTPIQERTPRTQEEFAQLVGVDPATLSTWKHRKGFFEQVHKRTKAWGQFRTADLIAALYTQILTSKKPTGRDVMVWFEIIENFTKGLRLDPPSGDIDEEHAKKIQKSLSGLKSIQKKILNQLEDE